MDQSTLKLTLYRNLEAACIKPIFIFCYDDHNINDKGHTCNILLHHNMQFDEDYNMRDLLN